MQPFYFSISTSYQILKNNLNVSWHLVFYRPFSIGIFIFIRFSSISFYNSFISFLFQFSFIFSPFSNCRYKHSLTKVTILLYFVLHLHQIFNDAQFPFQYVSLTFPLSISHFLYIILFLLQYKGILYRWIEFIFIFFLHTVNFHELNWELQTIEKNFLKYSRMEISFSFNRWKDEQKWK